MSHSLLARIAAAAGAAAALAIGRRFGGAKVYIARDPAADSPLARCVGLETARRIARAIGPGTFAVPHPPTESLRAARRRAEARYAELAARGASVSEIARATGFHRRTIERRRARAARAHEAAG